MKLTPLAHMILSRQNAKMSWADAFSEFIDNSFAPNKGGANCISIGITRDTVYVWDNGRGMDDINRLFQLGNSSSYKDSTDIGLYGVGATDAILSIGPLVEAWSVRQGLLQHHTVDWDACRAKNEWPEGYTSDPPKATKRNTPEQLRHSDGFHGLLISIRRREGKHAVAYSQLREKLSEVFGPGLRNNKRIIVVHPVGKNSKLTTHVLTAVPYPAMHDEILFSGEVRGLKFSGACGIMDPVVTHYNGFFFEFGHRVIEVTKDPAKDLISGSIHGHVELHSDWRDCLSDHKSEVSKYRDELMDEIFAKCKPVLEKAHRESETVILEDLSLELTQNVHLDLDTDGDVPNRRNPSGSGGEGSNPKPGPENLPPVNGAEENDSIGDVVRRRMGGLQVRFEPLPSPYTVSESKDPQALIVTLSTLHHKELLPERPPEGLRRALHGALSSHFVMEDLTHSRTFIKGQKLSTQCSSNEEFVSEVGRSVWEVLWPETGKS